jgi:hypothetical protein
VPEKNTPAKPGHDSLWDIYGKSHAKCVALVSVEEERQMSNFWEDLERMEYLVARYHF